MNGYKKYLALLLMARLSVADQSEVSNDLQPYKNEIVAVSQIEGTHFSTVRLVFEHSNPIMVYAPASYQETQDQSEKRYLLPNTTIAESCEFQGDDLVQDQKHVTLFVCGKMVALVNQDNQIIITTEKKVCG